MSKKKKKKDPHHRREAQKYAHPVPSREYLLDYMKECGHPVTSKELHKVFDLHTPEEH